MLNLPTALLALLMGLPAAPSPDSTAPTDPIRQVEAALERGDLGLAIQAGERAVELDPSGSIAHDLLGRAYGLKAKDSYLFAQAHLARKARACFEKAVALDPSNVSARSDLATYDMRAPALLGGGKAKARRQAEEVLKLDAARGHELLGDLADREKDSSEAEAQYRLAVEVSAPGQGRARRALSEFFVRTKRFPAARQIWLDVLEADRSNLAARYELAGIAIDSGEGLEPAAERLSEALAWPVVSADPSRAQVYERLAQVERQLGRPERARVELEEALRLEPYRTDWRRSLSQLGR